MPYAKGLFEIEFDSIDHNLVIKTSEGAIERIRLETKSVRQFYDELLRIQNSLGINPEICCLPDEIPGAIPFDEDETHQSYDAEYANHFWRALFQVDKIFNEFRSKFIGKVSPTFFLLEQF